LIDPWDQIAPQYDAWYATPLGAFALEVEIAALVALGGQLAGRRGLEVGCGTGSSVRPSRKAACAWSVSIVLPRCSRKPRVT